MEALLSLMVVIIMIFVKASKNGKGSGKKPQPQRYPSQPQRYSEQPQPRSSQPQRYPAQSQPGNQAELKRRLQEKYGSVHEKEPVFSRQMKTPESVADAIYRVPESSEDILYHAAENVAEYDRVDELEQTDYMKQINDLMIMGFTQELPNQRDFVAEGIEMLNRFELPANELPVTDFEISGI